MNEENDPVYIGQSDDIDEDTVENFEHEEIDYAIYRLKSGFYATQGHCHCEEQAYLSEGNIDTEELECASCGQIFSIVSGDSISDPEAIPLKTYDMSNDDENIYLIL